LRAILTEMARNMHTKDQSQDWSQSSHIQNGQNCASSDFSLYEDWDTDEYEYPEAFDDYCDIRQKRILNSNFERKLDNENNQRLSALATQEYLDGDEESAEVEIPKHNPIADALAKAKKSKKRR